MLTDQSSFAAREIIDVSPSRTLYSFCCSSSVFALSRSFFSFTHTHTRDVLIFFRLSPTPSNHLHDLLHLSAVASLQLARPDRFHRGCMFTGGSAFPIGCSFRSSSSGREWIIRGKHPRSQFWFTFNHLPASCYPKSNY